MATEYIDLDHAGVVLKEEFLDPLKISQNQLAMAAGVPKSRISEIIHGKRRITAETGMRISRSLGMSDGFFYGLQVKYDNRIAAQSLENVVIVKLKSAA